MGQDIRELLKNENFFDDSHIPEMSQNHQSSFLDKLNENFPQQEEVEPIELPSENKVVALFASSKKRNYTVAASVTVLIALTSYFYPYNVQQTSNDVVYSLNDNSAEVIPSLAEVSPEFKEVEDYYLASINVELASLQVNDDNKSIVDSFMKQLSRLDDEYKVLQKELQNDGAHTYTIEALINNLQMRLEMLQQLKQNLKNINENQTDTYQNLQV